MIFSKFLRRQKKNPKLYKLYKQESIAQLEYQSADKLQVYRKEKEKEVVKGRHKEINQETKFAEKVSEKRVLTYPVIIRVQSLEKGAGSTHVSLVLSNCFKRNVDESVCIVSSNVHSHIDNSDIYSIDDFYQCCERYKYIILDLSIVQVKEASLAHKKVMVALKKESYLQELASFLETTTDSKEWIYIFNLTPQKDESEIHDLMEDYKHFCFGACDPVDIGSKTEKNLQKLIFDRR